MVQNRVAIINAKFQIRQRRYHQCSKLPNFKSTNAATNQTKPILTFDFGGYDYWRLLILAGTALAVLKFFVCGCRPKNRTAMHEDGS